MTTRPPSVRRGSVYVAVLGSAVIVTILGLSATALLRLELRELSFATDAGHATAHARSAVEMGLYWINRDRANWRSRGDGAWVTDAPVGGGTYSLSVQDPDDGNLLDDVMDPVVLTGTGRHGRAQRRIAVTLEARKRPLNCLGSALHVDYALDFDWRCTVYGSGELTSNGWSHADSAKVYPDVRTVGSIYGWSYYGKTTSGASPWDLPDPATVWDHYKGEGTWISIGSLPENSDKRWIYRRVLSPSSNPFGSTNAKGVYIIDCRGWPVVVRQSRIVGTLVLLNPGSGTRVDETNHIAPAIANYPSLLVDGDITFSGSNGSLDEDNQDTNYNPPGTAYEGVIDYDQVDKYPSMVQGLVAVAGTLRLYGTNTFQGVVLAGGMSTGSNVVLRFDYDATCYNDPPPGFQAPPEMVVAPGTWQRMTN